ncbi:hypothetical protein Tco_1406889, partial [Tanacetum coccineum]
MLIVSHQSTTPLTINGGNEEIGGTKLDSSRMCAAVEVAEASDSRSLPSFQYPQNRLQDFDPQ